VWRSRASTNANCGNSVTLMSCSDGRYFRVGLIDEVSTARHLALRWKCLRVCGSDDGAAIIRDASKMPSSCSKLAGAAEYLNLVAVSLSICACWVAVVLFEVQAKWLGNRQPFPTSADKSNTALPDASARSARLESKMIWDRQLPWIVVPRHTVALDDGQKET
jgi:hypothetical protein